MGYSKLLLIHTTLSSQADSQRQSSDQLWSSVQQAYAVTTALILSAVDVTI